MTSNFPFNCWYVAATSDEVGQDLLARRLLGVPVVLYRLGSGEIVAMEDRCVHRAYPLSAGTRDGDRLVCGYHGFSYDSDGCLVDVPSQENVPAGACVRTYPVHEQAPLIWIWLGDPRAAALRPPPQAPWSTDTGWARTVETLRVEANYLLLHEHYLDLTNVFYMYPQAAPPGIDALPPLEEVEISERSVSYSRVLPLAPLAEWEAEATGIPRETLCVRREQGTFVSPALHVQRYVIEPEDGRAYDQMRIQGFTPESPTSTHVFLQIARNYATARSVVAEHLRVMFHGMAMQDAAVLETIQRRLGEDVDPRRDINVKADRAAVRARRIAKAMVDEEHGWAALRSIAAPFGRN